MKHYTNSKGTTVIDDKGIMVSEYGKRPEPKSSKNTRGNWKLVGYVLPGKKPSSYSEFSPGCRLLFFDEAEEGISYKVAYGLSGSVTLKTTERPLQHRFSDPVETMEEL